MTTKIGMLQTTLGRMDSRQAGLVGVGKMKTRFSVAVVGVAFASAISGWAQSANADMYVSMFGGLLLPIHADAWAHLGSGCDDPWPTVADCDMFRVNTAAGHRYGAAIGAYLFPTVAAGGELTFGRVDLDNFEFPPGDPPADISDADATANLLSLMADIMISGPIGGLRPYIAIGAGAVRVGLDVPGGVFGADEAVGTDWTWGAQLSVGADLAVANGISFGARYRAQIIGPSHFVDGADDNIHIDRLTTQGIEFVLTLRR